MIRALRIRHRIAWTVMGVGLPLLFLSALASRRPPQSMAVRPDLSTRDLGAWVTTGFQDQIFGDLPIRWNQIGDGEPPARAGIELLRSAPLTVPDPLLYWSADRPEDEASLPGTAYLVGAVGADEVQRFPLPADALLKSGVLYVYSLAHQEVVALAVWPSLIFVDGESAP